MIQLLAHFWGDYLFQTDRMATMKIHQMRWAVIHALAYSVPFILAHVLGLLPLTLAAWLVIVVTHVFIDRYRLARFVIAAKNTLTAPSAWRAFFYGADGKLTVTGYPAAMPVWMSVWLVIIADNVLHVTINFAALHWLT